MATTGPLAAPASAEAPFGEVMARSASNHPSVEWDANMANPVQRYQAGGQRHEVWFLDAVTALNEARGVSDGGFRGIALWRLGAEDPDLWKVLEPNAWPAADYDPQQLSVLTAQKSVNQYGDGDVLRIVQTPHDGSRKVWRDADGMYAEQYGQLPSYYVIEASGGMHAKGPAGKVLCLTFDDGPDPRYTPARTGYSAQPRRARHLLRHRRQCRPEHRAGASANMPKGTTSATILTRIPNIALVSEERAALELSTTQRIIENALGVSTVLFRPPYNADSQPQTPEEILPVLRAQKAGYVTVGERIDPRDWVKGVSADEIVSEIGSELQSAEDPGHVILLHDAGGDRSATVAALPRILEGLQALGYRFVPLSELLGQTRAQLMPAPSAVEMRWARIEGGAFDSQGAFKKIIGMLFLWAIYLTLARSLFYGVLALAQKWRARHTRFDDSFRPPVSVIVAAYNEEKVIVRTVESILRNGYDDLELLIVDDGSQDATLEVLRRSFGDRPNVRILAQPNGGKSSALNNAIAHARHDILVALDADTIFRGGTIGKLVRHFADPQVGAVSGNARVGNRSRWITRFQSIEYIYGFNLDRRALDLLNAITVVPGAVGAWRKDLIAEAGRIRRRHAGRRHRPDSEDPARRLPHPLRRGRRGLHRGARRHARAGQAALPLGVRNIAGGLETSRRAVRSQVRVARIRGAAQHLDFPGAAVGPLALRRAGHDRGAVRGQLAHRAGVLSRLLRAGIPYRPDGLLAGRREALGSGAVILSAHLLPRADVLRGGQVADLRGARARGRLGKAGAAGDGRRGYSVKFQL